MNELTVVSNVEKESLMKRFLSALVKKSFAWLSAYPVGAAMPETMMFMNYIGTGLEEAITYQSVSYYKQDRV